MTKSKIQINVIQRGGEYFASRTFPENMCDFSPPGLVFSVTDEVAPNEVKALEERARQEARRRGISRVINLD